MSEKGKGSNETAGTDRRSANDKFSDQVSANDKTPDRISANDKPSGNGGTLVHRAMQLDVLRAVATIAVVALHAAGPVLYRYGTIPDREWWSANLIDSAVRFSVPVFLMLTGALLLPRTESTGSFLKRRFSRLLGPFIFWSIIYLAIALYFQPFSSINTSIELVMERLQKGASYHLWYVYMLIGIYLVIPILQRWVATATRRDQEYFIGLWLLALLVSKPFLTSYLPDFNLVYFSGYIGYVVLGHYLKQYFFGSLGSTDDGELQHKKTSGQHLQESDAIERRRKSTIFAAVSLVGAGFLITAIATAWISNKLGRFDQTFYEYLSFNVILMATGAFLLAGTLQKLPGWMVKPVNLLSRFSYGIYLSHVLVLKFADAIQWENQSATLHPAISILLLTAVTVIIALGISMALNKLPFGKYISG